MGTPDSLRVWWLGDPATPVRIGTLSWLASARQGVFQYDSGWSIALSPGLRPDSRVRHLSLPGFAIPGVFEDAGPDRWGRLVIERILRPARLSALDYLVLTGDQRFGCLGFSWSKELYDPSPESPIPELPSLDALHDAIRRIEENEPLDERQRRLLDSGRTFGGACPKARLWMEGEEWLIKFRASGDTLDTPLLEYGTLQLAKACGLHRVVEARRLSLAKGHAIAVRRFDRDRGRRFHVLSARTFIADTEGGGQRYGYDLLADALRRMAPAQQFKAECEDLFRRMVFNILIDNTDDHEKNHAVGYRPEGWVLAPVYDVLPQLTNLGYQAMSVGGDGAVSTLDNALSVCQRFSLSLSEARTIIAQVRQGLKPWRTHFKALGFQPVELDRIANSIERER